MKKLFIISNSSWNIYNFRLNLIIKLLDKCKIYISSPNDKFSEKFKDLSIEYIPINYSRKSFNFLTNFIIIIKYYIIFLKKKPDIVLLYTIKPNIFISISSLLTLKNIDQYNFITGIGNLYFSKKIKKNFILFLYKLSFLKSKKVIFQNSDDLNYFVNKKIVSKKKCVLISGSGIDSKFFKFCKLQKTNSEELKFLCVSRIIEHKGIIEYLNAAKLIKKEFPKISFTLIGSIDNQYPTKFNPKDLNNFQSIVDFVEFSENIYEFLKNCDCFILPSYREGTSKSLLEAASVGRPIITTNVPGCNNVVIDNVNGYLCKPKDSISLYKKIKKMINTDFITRDRMSIKGREIIENSFDNEVINNKIISLLDLN
tara:strand:- start:3180 stop:4286 length:1107 start_codon:yes stop_codon:yes gene_type:complete